MIANIRQAWASTSYRLASCYLYSNILIFYCISVYSEGSRVSKLYLTILIKQDLFFLDSISSYSSDFYYAGVDGSGWSLRSLSMFRYY